MKKRKRQARQVQGEGAPKMESVPEDVRNRQNRQKKIADSGFFTSTATDTTTNQLLLTGLNNAGTMSIFKNGNTIASSALSASYTPSINNIGKYTSVSTNNALQEIVFYNSEQSSNRTGIESNINTFYTIY